MKWLFYLAAIVAAFMALKVWQDEKQAKGAPQELATNVDERRGVAQRNRRDAERMRHAKLDALRANPANLTVKGTVDVEGHDLKLELIVDRSSGAIVETVEASMDIDSIVDDAIQSRAYDDIYPDDSEFEYR